MLAPPELVQLRDLLVLCAGSAGAVAVLTAVFRSVRRAVMDSTP